MSNLIPYRSIQGKGRNDPLNKSGSRSSTGLKKGIGRNSRQVVPMTITTQANPLHEQPTVYDSFTPQTKLRTDPSLTRRQAENKNLVDKHRGLNPQMDSRALARRDAAQRTRLQIQRRNLVKKTETTRPRTKINPKDAKDPETVKGMRSIVEIEAEERSVRRVGLMLNDELYEYNCGPRLDASSQGQIINNSMTPLTNLGPIV